MTRITESIAIALQHHQAGRLQAAEQIYRQILDIDPKQPDALHLLGVLAHQAGQHELAIDYIARAIRSKGTEAASHNNLGEAYRAAGRLPEAVASYRRALKLKPDFAEALNNLGNALQEQGHLDEAVASFRRALKLKPRYAEAHYNLGNAFRDQAKPKEAIASYRRALESKPDYAKVHCNLGVAFQDLEMFDEAIANYRRAVELMPNLPQGHNNLGRCLWQQLKLPEALASFDRALEFQPDFPPAQFNRSLVLLTQGAWEQGWPGFECRSGMKATFIHHFDTPAWNGEPLAGKTILLHAEQGLGDSIQFIRYAPLVKQQAARVIFACQKPLRSLLADCAGVDQLVASDDPLPAFDVHSPLMSLPRILKTTPENVPAPIPYLRAQPALVESWRERVCGVHGFKVGIAWQGSPNFSEDRRRSIPLRCFGPLAETPGVRLISLQKGHGTEQLAEVSFEVLNLADELDQTAGAFMDTAAVMMNLDLVVTSDTSLAHLAGALGVPVWVALPSVPDWRWLLDRDDTPWYPTMRLFRQSLARDWSETFRMIQAELETVKCLKNNQS